MNLSGFGFHILGLFLPLQVLVAWGISFLMPGAVVFRGPGWLRWLGGGRLLVFSSLDRRLLPDVFGCPVTRIASVDMSSEGDALLAKSCPSPVFPQTFGVERH